MNAAAYRPLPLPPAPSSDITVTGYGLQLLTFLLAERCTATMSDDQLELADHAAAIAVRGAGTYAPTMFDQVSDARHLIASTLRARATLEPGAPVLIGTPADRPNTGPMAPLQDVPIVRPPAPSYARPVAPVAIDF
jgi:hypothetical protein